MYRSYFSFPLLCSVMFLAGCGSTGNTFSSGSPQIVASPDKVSALLAESADRASTALETLASIERARTPTTPMAPIDNVPPELRRAITVNWVGPIEPIAKTLADRAGYSFRVLGSPPSIPVVVSLDVENTQVVEAFRDLGLQLGMRGDVKVDARNKVVEIYYVPNSGIGG
ncbi:MAG: DotD/TraH family lipoprotein [Alphaproteobacteria bacterium]|nr:DotD/TraH family lipoprotein [Alphaproteobacteria bacterium]